MSVSLMYDFLMMTFYATSLIDGWVAFDSIESEHPILSISLDPYWSTLLSVILCDYKLYTLCEYVETNLGHVHTQKKVKTTYKLRLLMLRVKKLRLVLRRVAGKFECVCVSKFGSSWVLMVIDISFYMQIESGIVSLES